MPFQFHGFCMKCREHRTIVNGVEATTKKGAPMQRGTCSKCGTTVTRMGAPKAEPS